MNQSQSHLNQEILKRYILGLLSDAETARVEAHLSRCGLCEETIEQLAAEDETLLSGLRRLLSEDPVLEESALQHALKQLENQLPGRLSKHSASQTQPPQASLNSGQTEETLGKIGVYQLLDKLGSGGMGTVYKAVHTQLEKIVAIKVLSARLFHDARAVSRFEREMRAVGRLNHPHIVLATDAGKHQGVPFLVTEYIQGEDLSQLVRRYGQLPVAEACELIRQAALGLQAAYEHGLVHRDIKPANLFLARQPHGPPIVKILDLGLARAVDATESGEELTADGQIMGTVDYMAPEQAADTRNVDIRADIYALGATLFRLLSGRTVYDDRQFRTPVQKLTALATLPAPPIESLRADLPEQLSAIVQRMLAKDPQQRFATPQQVAEALQPFTQGADLHRLLACGDQAPLPLQEQAASPTVEQEADRTQETVVLPNTRTAASSRTAARKTSRPVTRSAPRSKFRWALWLLLALVAGATLLALVFKLRTPQGTLIVEVPDPRNVVVEIDGHRANVELLPDGKRLQISVDPGTRRLVVKTSDGTVLKTNGDQVELAAGQTRLIRAWLEKSTHPESKNPRPTSEVSAWLDEVARLPAVKKAQAVAQELRRRNPNFQGEIHWQVTGDRVSHWIILNGRMENLRPLLALEGLKQLEYPALQPRRDAEVLREITSLEAINGYSARSFRLAYPSHKPSHGRGVTPQWLQQIRRLPPQARVQAVMDKLQELNPSFDGKYTFQIDRASQTIRTLSFDSAVVTDITPLAALSGLRGVMMPAGTEASPWPRCGWLEDLQPLRKMKLLRLHCQGTQVADLSPLRGMPLVELWCESTRVTDLEPLRGMPLERLHVYGTRVADLTPLRGTSLTVLRCDYTPIRDLAPLKGMPLHVLGLSHTEVADLTPLEGMPLERLNCEGTRVTDLSPLRGMKLVVLLCGHTQVADLSPLRGMPLQQLWFNHTHVTDISALRDMPLKNLNCEATPVSNFSTLQEMKLTSLHCSQTSLADLSPLRGMPLESLTIMHTPVADLSPLAGMPLKSLGANGTQVTDLSPLAGMPLVELWIQGTQVSDLSPLKRTKLKRLGFDQFTPENLRVVRSIKTLQIINNQPAQQFWKTQQASASARQESSRGQGPPRRKKK